MKNVFIIAEAGVNHNGSLELAYKLCDAARSANADAIKFQTWKTENILTKDVRMADYQADSLNNTISQFEMAKELELPYEDFLKIKKYCDNIGIQFLSTPDDKESLDFLVSMGMNLIKVGSGEVNNIPYLRQIGDKKKAVILSTGMSYLRDVDIAYDTLIEAGAESVSLLHCTTNYPCLMNEVNLKAMNTLKEAFKTKVGYSDHTLGIEVPIAAVAMGAEIIEKHFTLDKNMDGPDHKASLNPKELTEMIIAIRNIENALGDGKKRPNQSEMQIEKVVKKKIVADKLIFHGELFTEDNLTVKRSNNGISAQYWDLILRRTALKDYQKDEPIEF